MVEDGVSFNNNSWEGLAISFNYKFFKPHI